MVSPGVFYGGIGPLRIEPAGAMVNSSEYLQILSRDCLPDCHRYYGIPPDCFCQKDGASSRKARLEQELRAEKPPNFW